MGFNTLRRKLRSKYNVRRPCTREKLYLNREMIHSFLAKREHFPVSGMRHISKVFIGCVNSLWSGSGCWGVAQVAQYAQVTSNILVQLCAVGTGDPTSLHSASQHES